MNRPHTIEEFEPPSASETCSSAWSYLLHHGPQTIAEIRSLNRETLEPWTIGLLMSLLDCGIDLELRADASVVAATHFGDRVVRDVIVVRDGGKCLCRLSEGNDGEFVVEAKKKPADWSLEKQMRYLSS